MGWLELHHWQGIRSYRTPTPCHHAASDLSSRAITGDSGYHFLCGKWKH